MIPADVGRLACPSCRGTLAFDGQLDAGHLAVGRLRCGACEWDWPVENGLPDLVDSMRVRGLDRLMRFVYDHLAPLHDPAVRYLLPLLQWSSEKALRDGYMRRLELDRLAAPTSAEPVRVLEVGVGAGANLPLLERDLSRGTDVDLWGVDLSRGMIALCRRRLAQGHGRPVRLLLADAHALPFPDASFDRVFHVGGIGAYRDPRTALAEMARVARPATPIVVVDEQLDPGRVQPLFHRLAFRALTFYDPTPACPVALLPAGAYDVVEEQVSRFYYCLTFRMPPRASRLTSERPA